MAQNLQKGPKEMKDKDENETEVSKKYFSSKPLQIVTGDANNQVEEVNSQTKIRGKCKWFNPEKGFGFIVPYTGGKDIFIHQSEITAEKNRLRSLENGEEVEFTFYVNEHNMRRAKDVRLPGGKPVRGKPRRYLQNLQKERMLLKNQESAQSYSPYGYFPHQRSSPDAELIEYQVNGITYHPIAEEVRDYFNLYATLWDGLNQPLCDIWKFNNEYFVLGS